MALEQKIEVFVHPCVLAWGSVTVVGILSLHERGEEPLYLV